MFYLNEMTLKVEIGKIPDTNSNLVTSWEEYNLNGQIKKKNARRFVVPEAKTDEFVKKYKKTEKVSRTATMLTALTGFFGFGGLALQGCNKNPKLHYFLNFPIYAALAGAILGAAISYQITGSREKKLLQTFSASEIKIEK